MGLIRVVIFALVGLMAYLMFRRAFSTQPGRAHPQAEDDRLGRLVQDPQCGVYVDSREAVRRKVPDGELFFCSKDCANAYLEQARHGS